MVLNVLELRAVDTYDLRDRVLRGGGGHDGFPEDDRPGTFHLGAVDGEKILGVATFVPHEPGVWQLRGMAVDPEQHGKGVGRAILDHAMTRLRSSGARLAWANGRDSALGFYERAGWSVVGEGFVISVDGTDLPHHRIEFDLSAPTSS